MDRRLIQHIWCYLLDLIISGGVYHVVMGGGPREVEGCEPPVEMGGERRVVVVCGGLVLGCGGGLMVVLV
ncbi:hypothetical protein Hanom_Chr10g00958481 [Helianthus anomalus]